VTYNISVTNIIIAATFFLAFSDYLDDFALQNAFLTVPCYQMQS